MNTTKHILIFLILAFLVDKIITLRISLSTSPLVTVPLTSPQTISALPQSSTKPVVPALNSIQTKTTKTKNKQTIKVKQTNAPSISTAPTVNVNKNGVIAPSIRTAKAVLPPTTPSQQILQLPQQIIPSNLKSIILGQINSTNINLYTSIDQTAGMIHIYLTYPGNHWFGIGFGSQMQGSDMIIIEIVNVSIIKVSDMISTGYTNPLLDTTFGGTEDVKLIQSSIQSGIVTVHLERKLNTGDINDFQISGAGPQQLIWAWSPTLTLNTHTSGGNFGIVTAQLG